MKYNKDDVEKISALVAEYWRRNQDSDWYQQELQILAEEIGEERVMQARQYYEEERMFMCEADEERRRG